MVEERKSCVICLDALVRQSAQELADAEWGGLYLDQALCCCVGSDTGVHARRLALNVDADDVVHKLRSDASIPWMAQLNL